MNTDEQDRTVCLNQLDPKVTEKLLYELFLQAGPLTKVTIPSRQSTTDRSFPLKHAYVLYEHKCSVDYAINVFKNTKLFGRQLILFPKKNKKPSVMQPAYHQTSYNGQHWRGGYHAGTSRGVGGPNFYALNAQQIVPSPSSYPNMIPHMNYAVRGQFPPSFQNPRPDVGFVGGYSMPRPESFGRGRSLPTYPNSGFDGGFQTDNRMRSHQSWGQSELGPSWHPYSEFNGGFGSHQFSHPNLGTNSGFERAPFPPSYPHQAVYWGFERAPFRPLYPHQAVDWGFERAPFRPSYPHQSVDLGFERAPLPPSYPHQGVDWGSGAGGIRGHEGWESERGRTNPNPSHYHPYRRRNWS